MASTVVDTRCKQPIQVYSQAQIGWLGLRVGHYYSFYVKSVTREWSAPKVQNIACFEWVLLAHCCGGCRFYGPPDMFV